MSDIPATCTETTFVPWNYFLHTIRLFEPKNAENLNIQSMILDQQSSRFLRPNEPISTYIHHTCSLNLYFVSELRFHHVFFIFSNSI